MQWNGYLAAAFGWMLLTVPAALAFAKLGFPKIPWWTLWLTALVSGWILTAASFRAFPPDNGFGAAFAHLSGWLTMLPIFGLFSLVWKKRAWRGSNAARIISFLLVLLSVALPLRASLLWIPEDEARETAAWELRQRAYKDFKITGAQKTWDGWTVQVLLPDRTKYPVFLSRSGHCTGMGG